MNKTGEMMNNDDGWFKEGREEAANTEVRITPKERVKPSKTPVLYDPHLADFKSANEESKKLKFGIKPLVINTNVGFRDLANATPIILPTYLAKDSLSP